MIPTPQTIVQMVKAYAVERYGSSEAGATLGPDDDLDSLGLDSVDLVCVAAEVEDKCGIVIDPAIFITARTARQIAAKLDQTRSDRLPIMPKERA